MDASSPERRRDSEEDVAGGDPACWLARVCPECGLFFEGAPPAVCERCGAPVPGDQEVGP